MKNLIAKLTTYNNWRRGDETIPQPDPEEVGEAIDDAILLLKHFSQKRESVEIDFAGQLKALLKITATDVTCIAAMNGGGHIINQKDIFITNKP